MNNSALENLVAQLTAEYGPIIDVDQAATIARRSKQTIYDWSSRRRLDAFRAKQPGPISLSLDGFVRFLYGDVDEQGEHQG